MFLNVGCGEGALPPHSHAPAPWVNVDIRPSVRPNVVADVLALPFRDGSAERAYCGHVLEHLPLPLVPDALLEVRRVLAPGGRFLAVGPDVPKALAMHAQGLITPERLESDRQHGEPGNVCLHAWDCAGAEVMRMLEEAGFEEVVEVPIADAPGHFPVFDRGSADQFAVLARKGAE